jgi:hypothetical protein
MPKIMSTKQLPLTITKTTYPVLLLLWFWNLSHAADDNSHAADLSQIIKEKEAEVQLLMKEKLQWQANINLFQENRNSKTELTQKRQQLKDMLDEIDQLKKNNESIKSQKDILNHQYRSHIDQIRTNAIGEKIESLKSTEGREYKDVTIKEIHPNGIRISHATGAVSLPFNRLPEKLQQRFNFDRDEALQFADQANQQQEALRKKLMKLKPKQLPKQPISMPALDINNLENLPLRPLQEEPAQVDGRIAVQAIASKRHGDRVSKKIEIAARAGTEQMRIVVSSSNGSGTIKTVEARQTACFTMWVGTKYTVKAYQNGRLIDEQSWIRKRGLGL